MVFLLALHDQGDQDVVIVAIVGGEVAAAHIQIERYRYGLVQVLVGADRAQGETTNQLQIQGRNRGHGARVFSVPVGLDQSQTQSDFHLLESKSLWVKTWSTYTCPRKSSVA
jgi:hypothetical protein